MVGLYWLSYLRYGGAFIKLKTPQSSKVQVFDVGIAGPIAGFIAAIAVLIYGFTNLPPLDYLYQIHPEYQQITGDTVYLTLKCQMKCKYFWLAIICYSTS